MAPKKGTKCAGCGNKIGSGEPTVDALGKKFHKGCFNCVSCHNPIDGDFHPIGNDPWCNDCFLEKQAPKCGECGKPVTGTLMKTDDGRIFHEECSKKLTQGTCQACKNAIGFTEPAVEALGNKYHEPCFRCANCGGAVPPEFHAENGRPWCEACYNDKRAASAPICQECNGPIVKGARLEVAGRVYHEDCFGHAGWGPCAACNGKVLFTEPSLRVAALNRHYHLGCLNCDGCNENIRTPFYLRHDRPCCESCYLGHVAPKCQACALPIAGQQVKAMNTFWHPECFVCTVCHDMLHKFGKEYFNVQGKPYCRHDVEAGGIPVVG